MIFSHFFHHNQSRGKASAAGQGQPRHVSHREATAAGDAVELRNGSVPHSGRRSHDGTVNSEKQGDIPRDSVQTGAPFPPLEGGLVGVDILHFNDFHRKLNPSQDGRVGGAARLAGLAAKTRQEFPNSVLVSVGDVANGNGDPPYGCGAWDEGVRSFEPVAKIFNEMKVDLLELGNSEFKDPSNNYESLQKGLISKFRGEVLCGNVERGPAYPDEHALDGIKPYSIKQLQGMNVAFIGLVAQDMATRANPLMGFGLAVANLDETLNKLIPEVRAKGADAVIVMAHESFNGCVDIASRVSGIDAILAGRDHKQSPEASEVKAPDGRTTLVTEAGSHGAFLGHMRLVLDPSTRSVLRVEDRLMPVDASAPTDPEVQAIVDAFNRNR